MKTNTELQKKAERPLSTANKNLKKQSDTTKNEKKPNVRTTNHKKTEEIFLTNPDSVTREEFMLFQSAVGYHRAIQLLNEGKRRKNLRKIDGTGEEVRNLSVNEQETNGTAEQKVLQATLKGEKEPIEKEVLTNNTSSATSLPSGLRSVLGKLSGIGLSDVSVNKNPEKPQQVGALAPTLQMKTGTLVNDDPELEKEADSVGTKAIMKGSKEADSMSGKASNLSGQSRQHKDNVKHHSAKNNKKNIVITRLSNKEFLKIVNNKIKYFGGDQDWYSRYAQRSGGCGPTAAANILAYMAMTNPKLKKLYDYNTKNITKEDFSNFMQEVYKYVTPDEIPFISDISDVISDVNAFDKYPDIKNTKDKFLEIPPSVGISNVKDFARGVEKFAKSKGINLKANWSDEKLTFKSAVNYIRKALEKDCPVALLNVFHPIDMDWKDPKTKTFEKQIYEQHWVTVTGITENTRTGEVKLTVSSWGGEATISLNSLYDNEGLKEKLNELLFPLGIIYFEYKPDEASPTPCPAPTPPLRK